MYIKRKLFWWDLFTCHDEVAFITILLLSDVIFAANFHPTRINYALINQLCNIRGGDTESLRSLVEETIVSNRKIVVVTEGVLSGIGKGVTASSLGVLLRGMGIRVTTLEIDPYLNVVAGTMRSPFEHGEVFVLDDGGETDLDFGL